MHQPRAHALNTSVSESASSFKSFKLSTTDRPLFNLPAQTPIHKKKHFITNCKQLFKQKTHQFISMQSKRTGRHTSGNSVVQHLHTKTKNHLRYVRLCSGTLPKHLDDEIDSETNQNHLNISTHGKKLGRVRDISVITC
jgi:hypothetical protein